MVATANLELVLLPAGSIVGTAAGGRTVVLRPLTAAGTVSHRPVDRDGDFRFDNIPVGEYAMVVFPREPDTEHLARSINNPIRVSVLRGQATTVVAP